MSVPAQAIAIIQKFEGLRLKAYRDGAGVLTYGFGHTGLDVAEGLEITLSQADYLLNLDAQKAMDAVLRHVKVPLNDNQLSALISFVFNVGEGHFAGSGLLTVLNESKYGDVPKHLIQWNKANGQVEMGLTRRRQAECDLWNTSLTQ